MQVQRVMCGAIGLSVAIASSSPTHFLPLSSFSSVGRPAISSLQPTVVVERIGLPRAVAAPLQAVSEEMRSPNAMVSLSNTLTNAVIQDAQERFNTPELMLEMAPDTPADIGVEVELIEPVTWNECRGDSGPSRPMRGICPDITVSGWRVVVAGRGFPEPLRLVYYIPQGAEISFWTPQPDGLQSLSEAVQRRMLTQIAEDAGISSSSLHLFWAEARFFDRSLNSLEGAPSCGTAIRPGWVVQIKVDQAISGRSTQQPLWVYHTNITGTDVRLVSQGQWMPLP